MICPLRSMAMTISRELSTRFSKYTGGSWNMTRYSLFDLLPGMLLYPNCRHLVTRSVVMLGFPSPDRQARQDYWRHSHRIATLAMLLCSLAIGGCYWLKYGKLMRTHVDLLLSMADKMTNLLEDGQTVTPTMMNEFSYPLDRAGDFVRIVHPHYAERKSLQEFGPCLDAYDTLVHDMDWMRLQNEKDVNGFRQRVEALKAQGERVKATLVEEG